MFGFTKKCLLDYSVSVFNVITRINESKTSKKHISSECKCNCYGKKCNSNQNWNNNKCTCKCKSEKKQCVKQIIFGTLVHVLVKMVNI